MPVKWLLIINLATSLYMTGLIWFVQIVHYPLFGKVPEADFRVYEESHQRLTSFVVAPIMLTELGASIALIVAQPTSSLIWVASVMTLIVWGSTLLIQMPLHARLGKGRSHQTIDSLVNSNWLRTIAWSARSAALILVF